MATEVMIKGRVSRSLPQMDIDGGREGEPARISRYGEVGVFSPIRKTHSLIDEGSYFVANSGSATGILSSPAVGWVATTPCCVIYNGDSAGATAKRLYLDFILLNTTVVGSAASGLLRVEAAVYLDIGNRYSSAGTEITANIYNPNMDGPVRASVARVWFGAITATAASGSVRPISPLRVCRPTVSGTVADVVGETKLFNFGGVEGTLNGSVTIANANFITIPMPGIVIGPNQSALLYVWQNVGGTPVAATYAPEIAFWER